MSSTRILTYIPNLIGYFRISCTLAMCVTARTDPLLTTLLYSLSAIGDLFDGMAARRFKQSSQFGAVLDMATDRFSQACLLGVLYSLYEGWGSAFLIMMALDLGSHWFQVFSTQFCQESHHKTAAAEFRLLDIYYKTPYVLFIMCLTQEASMVALYVVKFESQVPGGLYVFAKVICYLFTPFLVFKHFINVVQWMNASLKIVKREEELKLKTK